ncbi:MAG: hypothetical protein IPM85_11845 [Chitinophagaceae bacterium]|nr:hypothetical protein [Chitinophagaceae bacterium]
MLAHYLYANKKLDLPGFGTFLLETNTIAVPENQKNKPILLEGVSFLQNTSVKEDPELITYISSHTGKIKPLASSDLESHLELAKQFLNIGKPFLLEGIGTISASKRDEYVFTPGIMLTEPLHEHNSHEQHHEVAEGPTDYKEVFYSKKKGQAWQKPFIFFLVIAGITFAVWGGYTVYKNSSDSKEKVVEEQKENTIFSADSSANTPLTVDTGSVINQNLILPHQ